MATLTLDQGKAALNKNALHRGFQPDQNLPAETLQRTESICYSTHIMSLKQQFLGSMSGHLLPKEAKNQSAVAKKQLSFNPYNMGGGSIASISGTDYCLIASDCRVATIGAFHIDARNVSRVLQLTEKCVIACAGVPADITTIYKTLQTRLTMYNQDHGRDMSVHSIAQMLSTILYQKRFFPHLIEPLVAGLDNDGKKFS